MVLLHNSSWGQCCPISTCQVTVGNLAFTVGAQQRMKEGRMEGRKADYSSTSFCNPRYLSIADLPTIYRGQGRLNGP